MRVSYLGWSGFRIEGGESPPIFIDPPRDATLPTDRRIVLLLTHGHPEHLGGTHVFLEKGRGGALLCASPGLCRYFARRYPSNPDIELHGLRPGDRMPLADGVSAEVFAWRHLPLLPPGLGASLRHIRRLASNPTLAASILRAGFRGPRPGPMLGFRLFVEGESLIAFGEGLHRKCRPQEAAAAAKGCAGGALLAAVEPEDASYLPRLIAATGATRTLLYEPHARWRDAFGLPRADVAALARRLRETGLVADIATPVDADVI